MAAMNKRKRESQDTAAARPAPGLNQMGSDTEQHYIQTEAGMTDGAAGMDFSSTNPDGTGPAHDGPMHAHPNGANNPAAAQMTPYHTMTVPQSTEETFAQASESNTYAFPPGLNAFVQDSHGMGTFDGAPQNEEPEENESPQIRPRPSTSGPAPTSPPGRRPAVGTDEWHKIRKDNHKEGEIMISRYTHRSRISANTMVVERRRRETINEGINEIAKIVPCGNLKNKGSILQIASQFITQLKENEASNIEKWTLEKMLTEQAIAELSSSLDKKQLECQRAWAQCEQWKKVAQDAGLNADIGEEDDGIGKVDE